MNPLSILALIGSIVMIVGVFLAWITVTGVYPDPETTNISGWDVYSESDASLFFDYTISPLIVLIMGVLAVIFSILPMVLPGKTSKISGILLLIFAIIGLTMAALFASNEMFTSDLFGSIFGTGIGIWVSIGGAVLVIIGGIIDLINKPKASAPESEPAAEIEE